MAKRIISALAIVSLATGCVTTREMASPPAIVGEQDQHLSFRGFTVRESKHGLRLSGWVRPGQTGMLSDIQTLHVELQKAGAVIAFKDVRWTPGHSGRPRRHLTSLFSTELPMEARSADLIRVSHVHAGHTDRSGSGDSQ